MSWLENQTKLKNPSPALAASDLRTWQRWLSLQLHCGSVVRGSKVQGAAGLEDGSNGRAEMMGCVSPGCIIEMAGHVPGNGHAVELDSVISDHAWL